MIRIAPLLLIALAACTERPDIDALLGPPPPGDTYPALLTVAELEAIDATADPAEQAKNEALLARGRALRARANGLTP